MKPVNRLLVLALALAMAFVVCPVQASAAVTLPLEATPDDIVTIPTEAVSIPTEIVNNPTVWEMVMSAVTDLHQCIGKENIGYILVGIACTQMVLFVIIAVLGNSILNNIADVLMAILEFLRAVIFGIGKFICFCINIWAQRHPIKGVHNHGASVPPPAQGE